MIDAEIILTCHELGISQIVWSPLAQGVLTGKYEPGRQPPAGSRATDETGGRELIARWMRDDVLQWVQALRPFADDAGVSLGVLALGWVLHNPDVSAAIIGASRPEQVLENARAADVRLDDSLVQRIDEILDPVVERDPSLIDVFHERP